MDLRRWPTCCCCVFWQTECGHDFPYVLLDWDDCKLDKESRRIVGAKNDGETGLLRRSEEMKKLLLFPDVAFFGWTDEWHGMMVFWMDDWDATTSWANGLTEAATGPDLAGKSLTGR